MRPMRHPPNMRWSALLVLLLLMPLVGAQDANAPPLSPDATLLYFDSNDGANGDAEITGFVSTIQDAGDDAALGPAGSCDPHTGNSAVDFTAVPPAQDIDRTYTFDMDPAQSGVATLGGDPQATLYIGAGSCYGEVDVTVRMMDGTTTVAEGTGSHQYNDASGNYPSVTVDLAVLEQTFDLSRLEIHVHVAGKTGGMLFMGIGSSRGFSNIDIPVTQIETTAAGPGTTYGNLTDVDLDFTFDNATDHVYLYNWTSAGGDYTAMAAGQLGNGSIRLLISDEGDSDVLSLTYNGTVAAEDAFTTLAGNHSLALVVTNVTGTFSLKLVQGPGTITDDDGEDPVGDDNDNEGNGTQDGGGDPESGASDDEESPAAPWVAAILAVAFLARRRRP